MRTASAFAVVMATVCLSAGCDEKLSDLAGPTPLLNVTFSSIQQNIFNLTDSAGRAGCINCHTNAGGRTPASGLNLAEGFSYDALVNRASVGKAGAIRVIPGDPDNSYLIQKIEGAPGIVGLRMPRGAMGPFLTDGQVTVIRRWIAEGAKNN
jgi:hypothetical protein